MANSRIIDSAEELRTQVKHLIGAKAKDAALDLFVAHFDLLGEGEDDTAFITECCDIIHPHELTAIIEKLTPQQRLALVLAYPFPFKRDFTGQMTSTLSEESVFALEKILPLS